VGPRVRALALVVVALAGCGLHGPRPLAPTTADALLEGLAARRQAVTSMRARVSVKAGLAGMWTREALVVQRPAGVRIDVLSPFGLAVAIGTDGSVLWAFPPAEGARYEGPATPENLARFLGVPVAVPDLIDILMGLPPMRATVGPAHLETTRAREYSLTLPLADGAQTLWFAGDPLVLVRAEEVRVGGAVLRVTFGDWQAGLPRTLDVTVPTTGAAVHLAYDAVEPNVLVDPTLFAPPPAARVLPLEAVTARPG
jgi:hypothetical protein